MMKVKLSINYETEREAKTPEQAHDQFFEFLCDNPTFLYDHIKAEEVNDPEEP